MDFKQTINEIKEEEKWNFESHEADEETLNMGSSKIFLEHETKVSLDSALL